MVWGRRKKEEKYSDYFSTDIYTEEALKLKDSIPYGYIVYGEIIGYADQEKPIQNGYTYNYVPSTRGLYIYRVAVVNEQGIMVDLSWDALKEFCASAGLNHVPELMRCKIRDFDPDVFMDKKFTEMGYSQAVPLASTSPCDEGVCVRIEGMIPQILKAKSPMFLQHETKQLDKGHEDMESTQSEEVVNA